MKIMKYFIALQKYLRIRCKNAENTRKDLRHFTIAAITSFVLEGVFGARFGAINLLPVA